MDKQDIEHYNWMLSHSPHAQDVLTNFKNKDILKYSISLLKLARLGYNFDEIYSFLKIMISLEQQSN